MTLQSDRTKIARSLGIDADISYGIYSAAASFLRETESDDLSVSYIFGGTINFKDVQVGGNYEVNPNLLDADVVKWYRLCGDSYVQRITRGASLYAALKFHFSDRLEKQQFESQGWPLGLGCSQGGAEGFAAVGSGLCFCRAGWRKRRRALERSFGSRSRDLRNGLDRPLSRVSPGHRALRQPFVPEAVRRRRRPPAHGCCARHGHRDHP